MGMYFGGKKKKVIKGSATVRPDCHIPLVQTLVPPAVFISGDALKIIARDDKTQAFTIIVDGEEKTTIYLDGGEE